MKTNAGSIGDDILFITLVILHISTNNIFNQFDNLNRKMYASFVFPFSLVLLHLLLFFLFFFLFFFIFPSLSIYITSLPDEIDPDVWTANLGETKTEFRIVDLSGSCVLTLLKDRLRIIPSNKQLEC